MWTSLDMKLEDDEKQSSESFNPILLGAFRK